MSPSTSLGTYCAVPTTRAIPRIASGITPTQVVPPNFDARSPTKIVFDKPLVICASRTRLLR